MTRRHGVSPGAEVKALARLAGAIVIGSLCLLANTATALEPVDSKTRQFLELSLIHI